MSTSHARHAALAITVIGAVMAPVSPAFAVESPAQVDLRADVNRDGRVDVSGTTDTDGEDSWAPGRGAVFLPNIDDDSKRCAVKGPGGKPLPDAKLAACNDASDAKVNGADDLADLARVRSVPMAKLPATATGTLRVVNGGKNTRVFLKHTTGWALVTAKTRLSTAELRSGRGSGSRAPTSYVTARSGTAAP